MGLGKWGKTLILRRVLKEFPMITKFWRWLTDPAAKGRKRGLTAALAVLSGALSGTGAGIAKACAMGALAGAVCTANVGGYAEWVDLVGVAVDKFVVPTVDAAAFLMGIWALVDARKKSKAEKDSVQRAW